MRAQDVTLLVLGPDGRILDVGHAGHGSPRAWRGMRVGDAVGLPSEVLETALRMIEDSVRSTSWLARRFVETAAKTYELVLVEAVPLRRTPTDVTALLTRTTELLLEQAKAIEVSLQVTTDPDMPSQLVVDGEKIAWGVATLVGSALRYLAGRGEGKAAGNGLVRVRARFAAESEEVVIVVRDNGPGIPHERLLGILEPGPDASQTSSLALIMLNDVITAHGGRLRIDSSVDADDHGTTVSLFIPAHAAMRPPAARDKTRRPQR